jgi:tRNA-uridine 2-sulfurtransferase
MKKKVAFVGLSGGVDSAVSAALLQKEGYEVVGVFIKTWHPEFIECNEEEERRDAMRVAAHLGIAFLTFDLEQVYKKEVADYMISEYKAGRTPNPDVMCNKEVKFGAFMSKALNMGADYIATGHYARTSGELLLKGKDPAKDQSYFLWTMTREQLKKVLFPIGGLKKPAVRRLAKKLKLPVAEKKDSQGICFLGPIDLKEFLRHYIIEKKGKVLNEEGEEIGHHDGALFHTLGERHGFTITKKSPEDAPYYIVGKDVEKNILAVSQNKNIRGAGIPTDLRLKSTNWINIVPVEGKNYFAQTRYHGEFLPCRVVSEGPAHGSLRQVTFERPVLVASGQSVVLYDGDICLGGGVVE